jgi:phytoene dehydrogenase-like protein
VLLLEAAKKAGGLASTREFHPGFRASAAHTISHFSKRVADDLDLLLHGYDNSPLPFATIGLGANGKHVTLNDGRVTGTSGDDAATYQHYAALMQRFAAVLEPFWHKAMPRIGNNSYGELLSFAQLGLKIRRLGKKDMQEFLRVISLPARDLMDENFDDEILKAILSWDGLIGSRMAPRSPNNATLAMLYRLAGKSGSINTVARGNLTELIDALQRSAIAKGVELRENAPVKRVKIDSSPNGLRATGVQLENGEEFESKRVVSALDPQKTFINLVGVEHLDIGFTNRIRRLRCDGYVAKLHLALKEAPAFDGLDGYDGRIIIAPNMDAIEFAFDHSKYGELPNNPVMEIVVPSNQDATLAPDGQHVLSAHVMYVPRNLKGGWTDTARNQLCERTVETLSHYVPNIRKQIIHQECLTPADLEREYHVTGGHWHHTEFALDQMLMMRPTYEAAQYSTPIPGLFLCGAGSHPGGDLVGVAGHNAAHEILR